MPSASPREAAHLGMPRRNGCSFVDGQFGKEKGGKVSSIPRTCFIILLGSVGDTHQILKLACWTASHHCDMCELTHLIRRVI